MDATEAILMVGIAVLAKMENGTPDWANAVLFVMMLGWYVAAAVGRLLS